MTPNVFIQECFDDFLEPWTEDVLYGCLRVELDEEEETMKHPYSPKAFLADVPAGVGAQGRGVARVTLRVWIWLRRGARFRVFEVCLGSQNGLFEWPQGTFPRVGL